MVAQTLPPSSHRSSWVLVLVAFHYLSFHPPHATLRSVLCMQCLILHHGLIVCVYVHVEQEHELVRLGPQLESARCVGGKTLVNPG